MTDNFDHFRHYFEKLLSERTLDVEQAEIWTDRASYVLTNSYLGLQDIYELHKFFEDEEKWNCEIHAEKILVNSLLSKSGVYEATKIKILIGDFD